LKKLDESDFRGFALEYVCKKTQEEIKVLLGLKNRQAVSAKSGKTMAKVQEYLEENPDIEGEGFVGSLISVLAKSGPFCENKSCGCYGEEASDER